MKYIIKKLFTLIITLLVISLLIFIAFSIIPGDSVIASLGTSATQETIEALREEMGLNKPLYIRYGNWLANILRGDFGTSTQYKIPVANLLKDRFTVTFFLAVLSILFIVAGSLPLGLLSAKKEGGMLDRLIVFFCQVNMAIPPFFLGMIITLVCGLILQLFTPGAYVAPDESIVGFINYLIFPSIAIALPKIGMLVKFLRSSLLRELRMDYVRTARSKGTSENRILFNHVLKNALIPVLTFFVMMVGEVFAGSIMIEQVFSLPGLGRLLVVAISNRDYHVVSTVVLYIATVIVVLNYMVDILYRYIDPRIRFS